MTPLVDCGPALWTNSWWPCSELLWTFDSYTSLQVLGKEKEYLIRRKSLFFFSLLKVCIDRIHPQKGLQRHMSVVDTIVSNGAYFGCNVDYDAAVLLCFLWRLLTKTTSALLQEGGEIFGHDQGTHCVGCQSGNDPLKSKVSIVIKETHKRAIFSFIVLHLFSFFIWLIGLPPFLHPSWMNHDRNSHCMALLKQYCTCAETSLRLVSPFPEGWSIAEELTRRSSLPKASFTCSAAPRISSSWFTFSFNIVSLAGCCPINPRSSSAPSGFLHVAITEANWLFFNICLQNASPSPLLAPWMRAMGAAMSRK